MKIKYSSGQEIENMESISPSDNLVLFSNFVRFIYDFLIIRIEVAAPAAAAAARRNS